jgi:hypothetical protein
VLLTGYGVTVLTFMMVMYALERRHHRYIAGFALGCALSASYGFLSGAWPFGAVEAVWAFIALRRFFAARKTDASEPAAPWRETGQR